MAALHSCRFIAKEPVQLAVGLSLMEDCWSVLLLQVCSLVLSTYGGHTRLITGSTDRELRVWAVLDEATASDEEKSQSQCAKGVPVVFLPLGSVQRKSTERVVSLQLSPTRPDVLVCQSADKALDVYRLRDAKEIAKRLKRRAKRAKDKAAASDTSHDGERVSHSNHA